MTATAGPAPDFTDEQRRALETRGVSIALSAGAGCGKTFVLTQRFLGHFESRTADGMNAEATGAEAIGQLVAITFTNAAAREMRDRIRRACYERLKAAEGQAADYWSALIRSLDSARISTIDSFCSSLLRAHAVEAGLDPEFTLLEAAQSGTLIAEFADDVLRASLSAHEPTTLDLAEQFGLEALRDMLCLLAAHRDAGQLESWLSRTPAEQVRCWADFHRDQIVPSIMRRVTESESGRQLLAFLAETVPSEPTVQAQRLALLEILQAWQAYKTVGGDPIADLETLRDNAKIKKRSPATWPSPEDYATFRDVCKELRERVIDRVSKPLAFDAAAALPAAEAGLRVLPLAVRVVQRYEREKRDTATLDFRDLLARAHALLTSPRQAALRRRVADQIQLLMVDEFQDTDPLQVDLIRTLCGDDLQTGKLFFVGDYKQSIYRFRGADPHVFRHLRDSVPPAGQLPLTLNFRSQPPILHFVNALFADVLGGAVADNREPSGSDPSGSRYEPLRAHRPQVSAGPSIEFLWALPDEPAAVKESVDDARRREADWIARRLRAMIESQAPLVWDAAAAKLGTPAARAVRLGDVAILFRALSDVAHYEEALRRHGLDYYLVGGHAFYAQQEIFDLANLLRAIAYPADAVSLVGALRSPLFCLADESLLWLARHPGGLTAGLFADRFPDELSGEQRQRVIHAAETLRALRNRKDNSTIVELIEEALARTGYDALLLAEFLGQRKLANLRKLIDQARRFEQGGMLGLADFIVELSGHVAEQPKEALAATHAADTDVIRLMSIHQSKGLEFPVVVIADFDRAVQTRSAPVEFTAKLGPLVRLPDRGDDSPPVGGYDLFNSLASEDDLAEAYRLLYVAATRTGDHLILSAGLPDLDKAQGPWAKLLRRRFDLETGKYVGPTLPDADVPQVAVIRERPECGAGGGTTRRTDWRQVIEQASELARANPACQQPLVDAVPVAARERREFSFSRLHGGMHVQVRSADESGTDSAGPQILAGARGRRAEPPAASGERIDALALGTLVHAVLAEIHCGEPVDVPALVSRHAKQHAGTAGGERKLAESLIENFLKSGRAKHLAAATSDFAEIEFLLAWPPGDGVSDRLQLTGVMDRLYEDHDGEWHILDFKTNRVDAATLPAVAANYELQMLVYALAAEQTLGRPPQSLTLHMLRTGDEFSFAWNDAARVRVRRMVDEAIAGLREPSEPAR